mmetsp:Transcript_29936/g.45783  ORF Transcript_29936/g.45783 Transcript_29936/m.45783 type:complete len:105 (+) Transcript_29936:799-1113(+)
MEFETEFGTVVQCSDVIVQKLTNFVLQHCEPRCMNGGVCQNGVCKCGKNFAGEQCEEVLSSSGSFSFLFFIFFIALVVVGIYLFYQRDKFRQEFSNYYGQSQAH